MANTLCRTIRFAAATHGVALRMALALALIGGAAPAIAGPTCTSEPAGKWTPVDELRKKLVEQGYRIDVLKVTKGGCYELYGRDRSGRRVEIYFHPISLDAVRTSVR